MKQKFRNQLVRQWLLLATLFLAACGGKEGPPDDATIKQAVAAANELVYENQAELAIQKLEALEAQAPGNSIVIEALAFAYAKRPDPGMAALYFDQAFQLNPSNTDLALYAGQGYLESGNPEAAAKAYRNYLKAAPDSPMAWKALATAELALKRNQAALDAYLESFRRSRAQPTHSESATVGHIYHTLNNKTQARKYYLQALRPGGDASDRLTAQLGLFEMALSEQQWAYAAELMDQIDREFPGELAAGPFAPARAELIKWRNAQTALQSPTVAQAITGVASPTGESVALADVTDTTETVAVVEETPAMVTFSEEDLLAASEAAPAVTPEEVSVTTGDTTGQAAAIVTETAAVVTETAEAATGAAADVDTTVDETTTVVAGTSGASGSLGNLADPGDPAAAKAQDVAAAEMVDLTEEVQLTETPASETIEVVTNATVVTETIATTADGAVTATVDTITERIDETATMSTTGALTADDIEVTETIEETTETIEPDGAITVTSVGERREGAETTAIATLETVATEEAPPTIMTDAELAKESFDAGDYPNAIRYYRRALAYGDTAELSYDLSRAYYANGQFRESEIYAAEATRLDPNNVRFVLNYLRAIQRTSNRDRMMSELVRAKEKFPNNPDITLALGRGYELLVGNTRNARFLYEEFVTMSPEHPKVPEIQQKLATMR